MKRLWRRPLALLLALSVAFGLLCGGAWAVETETPEVPAQTMGVVDSGTCGDNLTWTLDDAGTLTISGTGEMEDWASFAPWWGKHADTIKTVIIEPGVTGIGHEAFYECGSLTDVSIPDSVTSIGRQAFARCKSLSSVTIPNSVTSIGDRAFEECGGLTTVSIPNSVTEIGRWAFAYCTSLTSVTIPDNITEIDSYVFADCDSLASVTIPAGVTSIGVGAFSGCDSLASVSIPESVTSVHHQAFQDTPWMAAQGDFVIVNGILVKYQGKGKEATIPDGVVSIGASAFESCLSLGKVTVPASVTFIGESAFINCSNLTNICFLGNAPDVFYYDALRLVTATAYYPVGDTTWTAEKTKDYGGKITWKAGTPSDPVEKSAQTITAKNFTKTLGDAAFKLGAKTSGDGKLTYSSSNTKVATVSKAGKVTLKGVGKATITVTAAATDNCKKATKKVTITVKKPTVKTPTLSKLTNSKSKTMTVTWKKVADATGYEVQYTTDKKFKKSVKTVKVKKNTTSATVKKLTKKKKYYVQVRAYKTVLKTNYYSKWSGAKNLTIKK